MNEEKRLKTLLKYQILDTPAELFFDQITKLAATIFDIPYVAISFVDEDRIWFKSVYGLDTNCMIKEDGLCVSAILSDQFYMVEDAINDLRCSNNLLVTGNFGLQFYAAFPLIVKCGTVLGTLCILDKIPRTLTIREQDILKNLAQIVSEKLEIRLARHENNLALIEMSNMLKAIYESNQDAFTFIDKELIIRYTNQVAKNITKQIFGKEEQIGDFALDYVLPEYKSEFEEYFKRVIGGEFITIEKTDGSNWWRFSIYPVYNSSNEFVGIAHNVENSTNEKNILLQLENQNKVLKEISWKQSHEVRKPLSNILSMYQLHKDDKNATNIQKEEYLDYLYQSVNELDAIIKKIIVEINEINFDVQ